MAKEHIHLLNGSLAEMPDGQIIAQGFLDVEGMRSLKIGTYQRGILQNAKTRKISKLEATVASGGHFTNILLGMRGQRFKTNGKGLLLEDPVFNVDGQQRIHALLEYNKKHPKDSLLIGAEVRFGTTEESEKELFHKIQHDRIALSPNVYLRNIRDENLALATLWGLSHAKDSPLDGRVQWEQRRSSCELISAVTLMKTAVELHRFVPAAARDQHQLGGNKNNAGGNNPQGQLATVQHRANVIGLHAFRRNLVRFFELIDMCWGWRNISVNKKTTQARGNFLFALARVLADHTNFWSNDILIVPSMYRAALKSFDIHDDEIERLCGSSGMATDILYEILVKRLNKGRSANKITSRRKPGR